MATNQDVRKALTALESRLGQGLRDDGRALRVDRDGSWQAVDGRFLARRNRARQGGTS